jgi:hypothetical protein
MKGRDTPMPDPTKEEQAKARAAAEASAAARPAPAAMTEARPAPARQDFAAPVPADATPALVETLKNLEARSRPAGYASATPGLDEAPDGKPVYRVKGRLVNAHDREVNEDGSLVHPEQQSVDVYGRLT